MCSVVVAVALILLQLVISSKLDWDYPVLAARCRSKCLLRLQGAAPTQQKLLKLPIFKVCVEECLKSGWIKPGICVSGSEVNVTGDSSDPVFQETCIVACRTDIDCPGIEKCCKNSCGASCQSPHQLSHNPNLPEIPQNVTISEMLEKNSTHETLDAHGSWEMEGGLKQGKGIVFIVEERHHLGCNFSRKKLGPWTLARRELRPRVNLMSVMTPGRWYQIRVAAINENGTRGFSEPSKPFKLSFEPFEPETPSNITIKSVAIVNGSIWAELHWKPPFSNLPVYRYRICWGHVLISNTNYMDSRKTDSVYVKCSFVPKDQHVFFLRDLNAPNEFMVQVQAFARYCEKRKAGLTGDIRFFIDRVDGETVWYSENGSILEPNKLLNLDEVLSKPKVERMRWEQRQLSAHVRWEPAHGQSNLTYELNWRQVDCPRHRAAFAATADKTSYEINGLRFNSRYNLTLKTQSYMKFYVSFTIFKTPSCEEIENTDEKPECKSIEQLNCNPK